MVGAGPNGLAAGITLARAGRSVVIFERSSRIGGGLHTDGLTLSGFVHDVCSSVFPFGPSSPFFRTLRLGELGIEWAHPPLPVAHPLDGGYAVAAARSVEETTAELGEDRTAYARLFGPLANQAHELVEDVLCPLHVPKHPVLFARFGLDAMRAATTLATSRFRGARARALFGGLAAHSTLRLDAYASAAVGLVLGALVHAVGWPFVKGGASKLADAMAAEFRTLGGTIVTDHSVSSLDMLATVRTVFCDVTPRQLLSIAGDRVSPRFRAALRRYRYGPGVFKVDWALSDPIPWRARLCRLAGTVHVGGELDEVVRAEAAAWNGDVPERPFVLVTQPSVADSSRAPAGRHVAWGYCHVPHGSPADLTERIESQIERFAPGFRDTILARHSAAPADLERLNPNLIGGDIGGGALTLGQLFTRPTWRSYRTSSARLYICSSSTPPGGGVHGMCGYHAALTALRARHV